MLMDLGFSKDVFYDYWDIRNELLKASRKTYSLKVSLSEIEI
jgi:hypothetical protein